MAGNLLTFNRAMFFWNYLQQLLNIQKENNYIVIRTAERSFFACKKYL